MISLHNLLRLKGLGGFGTIDNADWSPLQSSFVKQVLCTSIAMMRTVLHVRADLDLVKKTQIGEKKYLSLFRTPSYRN